MVRGKPRLYVVCFFRIPKEGGNPDRYHWALASGPKGGGLKGMLLYHVRNVPRDGTVKWEFEEPPRDLSNGPTPSLLTFTAIAKIENLERLQQIARAVPVDADAPWQDFNCQLWVEQALAAIVAGACVGTNAIPDDWAILRQQCSSFSDPVLQGHIQGAKLSDPRPMQSLIPA